MARSVIPLKVLIAVAAIALAVVIWLAARTGETGNAGAEPFVLQELVCSTESQEANSASLDSPAARFERLLVGHTVVPDPSELEPLPELRKRFLQEVAKAILQLECTPTSDWASAVAFSGDVRFSVPFAYSDGYTKLPLLLHAALRVQGEDGVRSLGPVLFARQLLFAVEDVVFSPIAYLAADVIENAKPPDFPRKESMAGADQWFAALRVWWLQKARANAWDEELRVVQRMMEERGIRPDGTGAFPRQGRPGEGG